MHLFLLAETQAGPTEGDLVAFPLSSSGDGRKDSMMENVVENSRNLTGFCERTLPCLFLPPPSLNMMKSNLIRITGRRKGKEDVLCENCSSLKEKEGIGLESEEGL